MLAGLLWNGEGRGATYLGTGGGQWKPPSSPEHRLWTGREISPFGMLKTQSFIPPCGSRWGGGAEKEKTPSRRSTWKSVCSSNGGRLQCDLSTFSADKTKRALFQHPGAGMNKQPAKEPTEMAQRRYLRTYHLGTHDRSEKALCLSTTSTTLWWLPHLGGSCRAAPHTNAAWSSGRRWKV